MHLFLVIIISLVATLENILPSIMGFQQTPANAVFLGTVHHPNDYFYYLSQFTQGATRWLTTTNLYTSEITPDTFVGWSNVLTGHLFWLLSIPAIPAYQISIAIWTFLLCLSAYKLALLILKDKHKALLSLVLFVLYHAFPIFRDNHWTYADYWNNFSVPRVRFGGVPHQLLLNTLSVFTLSLLLQKKRLLMALSAFLLASLQPVLWLLVTASCGIVSLIKRRSIFPTLILMLSGLPAAIYLNKIFSTLPFSQLKIWEASQQVPLQITGFFLAMGPIFIIALLSLYIFLSKRTYERLIIFIFALLSLTFLMSPIPQMLHLTNIRFMSTLTILCISCIATEGLYAIQRRFPRILFFALTLFLTTLLLPNHMQTLLLATEFNPANAYEYLSKDDVKFLTSLTTIGNPSDTFLVLWPYNSIIPALTGQRSYNGHPLLTIHPSEKDVNAQAYFDQTMTSAQQKEFLINNTIRYIIAYSWQTNLKQISYLEPVKETDYLIVYKVELYP